MATTIIPATLTATITEDISLNDVTINSVNTLAITGITQIDKRIVSVPTASQVTLITLGTAVGSGQFVRASIRYIRITNKDATNFVRIRVSKTGAETFDIKLDAGKSFIIGNGSESVSASGAAFSAFVDADIIAAQADTAAVDVEFFVASI